MRSVYWTFVAAALVLVGGVLFGVAGIFLAPILGAIALVGIVVWLVQRAARDEPPIE